MAITGVFILIGAIATFHRNKVWESSDTLIAADIDKLDHCAKAQEQYADQLLNKFLQTNDPGLIPNIIDRYERAIEITEHAYYARITLGSNYARLGFPEKGIELLTQTAALFPDQSDPHFYLGNAYYDLDSFDRAIPELIISKNLAPKNEDSYFLIAKCHLETQQFELGIDLCREAIALFPQSYLFRDVLSDLHFESGQPGLAIAEIYKILDIQPLSEVFYKKLIGRLQQLGRLEEAMDAYQKALGLGLSMRN